MTVTVVTTCTNRKRLGAAPAISAADLPTGSTRAVAGEWGRRVSASPRVALARKLYGGRAFRDAEMASRRLGGDLRIVSAGLGLIDADTTAPAYGLTIVRGHPDCVLGKIDGGPAEWWEALSENSPVHADIPEGGGPIFAALSAPYLAMTGPDWEAWPEPQLRRLRIFSKTPPAGRLASAWMPYDDRLDAAGLDRAGTQSDFAQRALRHFAEIFGEGTGSAESDAALVSEALSGLTARFVPERKRLDDEALLVLIDAEWDAVGGRSGRMLRRLRDELGVACEQTRMKLLFQRVAQARGHRMFEAAS
jgi:hypothetical protein